MKHISIFFSLLLIISCNTVRYVPMPSETKVILRDSIIERIDTAFVTLPKEIVEKVVYPTDTLHLETTYANATAYIDTTSNLLKGSIQSNNKPLPVEIKEKTITVYRDSVVYQGIPIEVEKPIRDRQYYILFGWMIICWLYIIYRFYRYLNLF